MMKFRLFAIVALLGMLTAFPAYALDLQQARAAGLVGEQLNGYVAVVKPAPEVETLVESVNAKRRQEYLRISRENNQSVDVVAKLAAEQIINNLDAGSLYKGSDGSWKKR